MQSQIHFTHRSPHGTKLNLPFEVADADAIDDEMYLCEKKKYNMDGSNILIHPKIYPSPDKSLHAT